MFRTVPLSIVRTFSLYKQQWYMSYSFTEFSLQPFYNPLIFTIKIWHSLLVSSFSVMHISHISGVTTTRFVHVTCIALRCWIIRLIENFHEKHPGKPTSASNGIISSRSSSPLIESAAFCKAVYGVATLRMTLWIQTWLLPKCRNKIRLPKVIYSGEFWSEGQV